MPHVTWDSDLPPLFLAAYEEIIKQWVRDFFGGRGGDVLRILPDELALFVCNPPSRGFSIRVIQQKNLVTGMYRAQVQPASVADAKLMRAWAQRHAQFTVADFRRARALQ